ncbi:sensor histidine kinase [Actinoplanes sp. NPDC026619]|uniref:sensor histidine kinase n=1 Tax=Actinoplanes sp. NPDC026619 TaxID=3155798 RepID=UPI0033D53A63
MQSRQMAEWEDRSRPLVTVVPYVILALLAVAVRHDRLGLVLCAAAAVWNLALFTVHPPWRQRRAVMEVFLAGLIVFGLVMAFRTPWFGLYSPALYFFAYRIIGWPRELPFIAGAALVAGTAQATGLDYDTWAGRVAWLGVVAANIVPMCLLAWVGELGLRYHSRMTAALTENAALAHRAGVLDERARMAREIHDTLAQGLTGIVTQLQAAEHVADDPAAWRRHHAAATALARESLTEARRSVDELRPEPLETGRLADAITEVAARWSGRHRIPAQVTVTGDTRTMPPAAEVALLRTAQEALANVAKHAPTASRVGLTLSYLDHQTALDVRDDGDGFDAVEGNGFGLEAMRQRIEALDGTLQIESERGGGTGISASLPTEATT